MTNHISTFMIKSSMLYWINIDYLTWHKLRALTEWIVIGQKNEYRSLKNRIQMHQPHFRLKMIFFTWYKQKSVTNLTLFTSKQSKSKHTNTRVCYNGSYSQQNIIKCYIWLTI